MTTPHEIQQYVESLPNRIRGIAQEYASVQMFIDSTHVPLLASDLYRGIVITSPSAKDVPFEATLAHQMVDGAKTKPRIEIVLPSPAAIVMAHQLEAGTRVRKHAH